MRAKTIIATICCAGFLAAPVVAQNAPVQAPLMGSEATDDFAQAAAPANNTPPGFGGADGIYRVLVVGDALAGGLGAGMSRMIEADTRFEIVNRFNESSGLTRIEFYDWASAIPKITASKSFDAVVVLMGVNDRQDIRDGNARYVFRTANWEKSYRATVDRSLAAIQLAGAEVFWISLPPMADPTFDADMRYLSDIQKAQTEHAGGHFIDVRSYFVAADGSYVDRGADDTGVDRKLRARDGITFFKQGNNRFGQIVVGLIKNAALADEKAVVPVVAPVATQAAVVPPAAAVVVPSTPPVFGQAGLDGEAIAFDANSVRASISQQPKLSEAINQAEQSTGQRIRALAGSKAEKLLVEGQSTAAPLGRFDDFSVTAKN